MEKLNNLTETVNKKDILIDELFEKIRLLEVKIIANELTLNETEEIAGNEIEIEMNSTFLNPSVGFPCEKCDFIAKSKGGLQVHTKAKHKENVEILNPPTKDIGQIVALD